MAELLRFAKYLKKFTDVQQFAFLLSIQKGPDRMLGFFFAMGVGRKLTMGGLVDRELTLASGKQKVFIIHYVFLKLVVTFNTNTNNGLLILL